MSRLVAVVITLLLFGAGLAQPASAQDAGTLKVAQTDALGAFLTDAEGKTVYLFTQDTTASESTCTEGCLVNWPAVTPADATALPAGVPGELTTFDRADGKQQVAYNGIPLYYWIADQQAGDTTGQAVGGVWFVVPPGATHGEYAPAPGEGTPTPADTLRVGFTAELGPFLIDANGKTVYLFTNDKTKGESACSGDCLVNWPPVPVETTLVLPPGISGTLGEITGSDGKPQLTYNDIPLYFWIADQKAGDTTGQGVGDVWYVVTPGLEFGDAPDGAK